MDLIKTGWFTEYNELWPGVALSLQIDEVLHKTKSKFQDILVVKTATSGNALILDGIIQCTESDEFSYQEMASFLPLSCHPNPSKVLIIGGGDGGVAREVGKHPSVQSMDLVEIDQTVMDVSKMYLKHMAAGLSHPKLQIHVADGFDFMAKRENYYDVIITDSSDPVGPAIPLFQQNYYELMKRALRPGGIVCSQAGTPWSTLDIVTNTFEVCQKVFPVTAYGFTCVPTYPNGQIGFVLGSLDTTLKFDQPKRIWSDDELSEMKMRYYTSDVHRAAFCHPKFLRDALRKIS